MGIGWSAPTAGDITYIYATEARLDAHGHIAVLGGLVPHILSTERWIYTRKSRMMTS